MGLRPAFSARVEGIISRASANALKQYASAPVRVLACNISSLATSVSGAPPPAMRNLFLTRHLITHKASCKDLSASSSINLFEPLIMIEHVLPGVAIPVILTHLLEPVWISSTISADTKFSLVKWSKEAIGPAAKAVLHEKLYILS